MAEPAITLLAAHMSGDNVAQTRIVIHATCPGLGFPKASAAGQAHSTGVYFQSQSSGGSAHYVEDPIGEEHCVPENRIAWHAPPNAHSFGIELCGEASYTRAQWLDPQVLPVLKRAAARTADLCHRYGIPVVKLTVAELVANPDVKGICGHVDVSQAFHQSDHTDPGPGFPWDVFMQLVEEAYAPAPAPKPAPAPAPTPAPTPPPAPKPVPAPPAPKPNPWPTPQRGLPIVYSFWRQWFVNPDVRTFQARLVARGWHLSIDGKFGQQTLQVVKEFQADKHLVVDGIIGPKTWAAAWADPITP